MRLPNPGWSERKAAVSLKDKSNISGGFLPPLTLVIRCISLCSLMMAFR